jgi:hypothetical protein
MIRRQHHEQGHGHQKDLQKGTGKNTEGKKGRKKDQKRGKEKITDNNKGDTLWETKAVKRTKTRSTNKRLANRQKSLKIKRIKNQKAYRSREND